jgi:hypothetical protein
MALREGYRVSRNELADLRVAVVDVADRNEEEAAERLLGQLAALETQPRDGGRPVEFKPPARSADLARRAMDRLRSARRLASRRRRARRAR